VPIDDGGTPLSQEEARQQAYSLTSALNGPVDSAEAYRRRN